MIDFDSANQPIPPVIGSHRPKITIVNHHLQTLYQRLSLLTIVIPLLGTLVAFGTAIHSGISMMEVMLFISFYALTILGVEVGFHRYFSHNAFQTTQPIRILLAILGSMAAHGGVIFWVAHHRRHHQFTDLPGDPHSPNLHGSTFLDRLRGFWHAHMGWILQGEISNSLLFAKNLLQDPVINKVHQLQHIWVILGLVMPAVLGGMITESWMGAWKGLLWGGFVRIWFGQHMISATNSLGHLVGNRPFQVNDKSCNNGWLALLTWGESWHNNHHAFPNSAIVGLEWWQLDPGNWFIRSLEFLGLAWNVKQPTKAMQAIKKAP